MQTVTIPLNKTVPSGLGPELQKGLFFVSNEILDFALIEQDQRINALRLTTTRGSNEGLAEKINQFIESDILKQKVFKPKIVWQSSANGHAYYSNMFDTLVARGLAFEVGEGQVGIGEPLISLFHFFDRRIKQLALALPNAQEYQYPTLLPTSVLDAFGYFGSFPHFAMFVTRLHNDMDVYQAFRADYATHQRITASLFTHCQNHDYCLPPTMCYHTYHQLRDRTLATNRVVTARGKSFRFEAKYHRGLERLWDFTIREIVFLGTQEFVLESRRAFMQATFALMEELGLRGFCEVANDPFFVTQDTAGKIFNQRLMELKYELRLQVDQERTIAAGSFNFHERFFGETFKIHQADQTPILTACVGFGLERLVYAFLCQYGLNEAGWPQALKREL